jgi:hypothetical protein
MRSSSPGHKWPYVSNVVDAFSSGGGSNTHQVVGAEAGVAAVIVLPADPGAAAHELTAHLGGKRFAARWAKALLEALS